LLGRTNGYRISASCRASICRNAISRSILRGREVVYGIGELGELVPAYATTIQKSHRSEYPSVVIPLTTMLHRNLVYTGVTRGKRLVVLVGQRKALAISVKGSRSRRRSKLREWLKWARSP
jgi:exodeoxyribonuclease V alpha subunit